MPLPPCHCCRQAVLTVSTLPLDRPICAVCHAINCRGPHGTAARRRTVLSGPDAWWAESASVGDIVVSGILRCAVLARLARTAAPLVVAYYRDAFLAAVGDLVVYDGRPYQVVVTAQDDGVFYAVELLDLAW